MAEPTHDCLARHQLLMFLGDMDRGEQSRIAKEWGINGGHFSQILSGKVAAGLDAATKIELGTGGKVRAIAWRMPAPEAVAPQEIAS